MTGLQRNLVAAVLGLVGGVAGAAGWQWVAADDADARTRAYLLANPEILPEMVQALQQREGQDRLAAIGDAVRTPFPGAVLGNPNGQRVLVKFTDYACTYCRQSVPDTEAMIADDPGLKVVVREWPIFPGPGSEGAARMALAAARQGRYAAFYKAMFAAGQPNARTITAAAEAAGLDMAQARTDAASDAVTRELAQNGAFAERLGFGGTPSWVAGERVIEGLVGREPLTEALAAAD